MIRRFAGLLAAGALLWGLAPAEAGAAGKAAALLKKGGDALRTGKQVLRDIAQAFSDVDEIGGDAAKWSKPWRKELAEKRKDIEGLARAVERLEAPGGAADREAFAVDLARLSALAENEREDLSRRREAVRGEVDRCLREKKAVFNCQAVFEQIELEAYADAIENLQQAIAAKLKAAKKAPRAGR